MKNDYLKNLDNLSQGIKVILAKNHGSLSVDDLTFLKKCITDLEKLKVVRKSSDRKSGLSKFLSELLKTFIRLEIVTEVKDLIEDFVN